MGPRSSRLWWITEVLTAKCFFRLIVDKSKVLLQTPIMRFSIISIYLGLNAMQTVQPTRLLSAQINRPQTTEQAEEKLMS